jgi:hypothetical protein
MISVDIFGNILKCDFQLDQLDIVLKGLFEFISNYIQLDVQYILKINVTYEVDNMGFSPTYTIKIKDINEFNKFINSDYKEILSDINLDRNRIKYIYSSNHP